MLMKSKVFKYGELPFSGICLPHYREMRNKLNR